MSLQVWLPLNGDIKNRGLSGDGVGVTTSPTYTDSGKIGEAIATGALYLAGSQIDKIFNNTELSISFWVYPHSNTNGGILFGNDSTSTNGGRKFSIYLYPTVNDLHLSWQNGANEEPFIAKVWSGVFPSNQWTHCCVTYRNPNCSIYINGILTYTHSGVSNSSSFTYDTTILNNASNRYVNDLRIYDHCLSAKEVKEISKGLTCHYKLSNPYETGRSNKYGGTVASGAMPFKSGSFTMTALENERGYNYKFTYTGTGESSWPSMSAENYSFTAGKRYYYSCKVRCHSANFSMQLRASRSNNDWVTNMTNVISSSLADGKWHEYVVSQVVNSTYDRVGETITCNPVLEFYTEDLSTSGKVYSADFDMKDVQVIESDWYMPFIDGSMSTTVVSDCSGLGNNGIAVGSITYKNSSVRYDGCYAFTGDDYIKIPKPLTISNSSYFTIAMWVKPESGCGAYSTILSNFNSPDSGFWVAINTEDSGTWFYNGTYAKGNSLLTVGQWSHIAMVFNAGTITWYTNGVATSTSNVSSRATAFTDYIAIGNSYAGTTWNTDFVGSISDVRIYSSVLSAEDIKALYNIPASVDKNGTMYAYEFMEE